MNPETHSCDCGYTWRHGHSGTHLCGPQYRATIERQAQEIAALKALQPVAWMHTLSEGEFGDSGWNVQFLRSQKEADEEMRVHGGTAQALFPSQSAIQVHDQDIEQLARSKWTVKQWYEHVGAWENAQGEVCFGSVMALGAMLQLMAKARHSAIPVAQQDAKPLCYVRQSDIDSPIGSAIWAYRMAGGEWTVPVHVSIKDQPQ